jgi:hypothetical protein
LYIGSPRENLLNSSKAISLIEYQNDVLLVKNKPSLY